MGMECPKGHGRQNVVVNLTADGSNPLRSTDIIAQKLACGCVVGGEQYEKFRETVAEIEKERIETLQAAEELARQKKAASYQAYLVKKET